MDNADYSKNPGESLSYLEEAQIQMKKRPKLSIVLRLTVAFLICFVISLGSALIIILTIHNVKNNYYFIEIIHSYSLNLQKGRVLLYNPQKELCPRKCKFHLPRFLLVRGYFSGM